MELTGFEPVTPSLRTRCSAELSYSPWEQGILLTATSSAIRGLGRSPLPGFAGTPSKVSRSAPS